MACRDCEYFNPNETWGSKCYCEWYKQYCYASDRECSHFKKRESGSGGCFLTSACCDYKGLSDGCYELSTLRSFRDGYMKKVQGGSELIEEYYSVAPSIVEKIDASEDFSAEYEYIYSVVTECVEMIENEDNENALKKYSSMVNHLKNKYMM